MTDKSMVVLATGGGTNLQALIDAVEAGHVPARISGVVVNRKDAYALTRAAKHGIPALYFPLKPYTDAGRPRTEYDADLAAKVAEFAPDLVVLAGWMHVLSPAFLNVFPNRVINLHPALPGQFAGTQAIERAFEAYGRGEIDRGGCMVHVVVPEVDAGPVIASAEVAIHPDDTFETYAARLHAAEHQLIVQAAIIALGRL
ncbi:MAG: phosphoribosylglycinamide formyltransferase [Chloroflexi bacterium]|nr:phosphoribosylglycinamide formyltransferase [Chloroflexota bacterium]